MPAIFYLSLWASFPSFPQLVRLPKGFLPFRCELIVLFRRQEVILLGRCCCFGFGGPGVRSYFVAVPFHTPHRLLGSILSLLFLMSVQQVSTLHCFTHFTHSGSCEGHAKKHFLWPLVSVFLSICWLLQPISACASVWP